jgi:hypothetical protein
MTSGVATVTSCGETIRSLAAFLRQFPPCRIVCLTEETIETLYLLGEQDRIVGCPVMRCGRRSLVHFAGQSVGRAGADRRLEDAPHGVVIFPLFEGPSKRRWPGPLAHAGFQERPQMLEQFRKCLQGGRLIERAGLLLEERQIVLRVKDELTTAIDARMSGDLARAELMPKLGKLPSIPGLAETPESKVALARAWLRCWRNNGFWLA